MGCGTSTAVESNCYSPTDQHLHPSNNIKNASNCDDSSNKKHALGENKEAMTPSDELIQNDTVITTSRECDSKSEAHIGNDIFTARAENDNNPTTKSDETSIVKVASANDNEAIHNDTNVGTDEINDMNVNNVITEDKSMSCSTLTDLNSKLNVEKLTNDSVNVLNATAQQKTIENNLCSSPPSVIATVSTQSLKDKILPGEQQEHVINVASIEHETDKKNDSLQEDKLSRPASSKSTKSMQLTPLEKQKEIDGSTSSRKSLTSTKKRFSAGRERKSASSINSELRANSKGQKNSLQCQSINSEQTATDSKVFSEFQLGEATTRMAKYTKTGDKQQENTQSSSSLRLQNGRQSVISVPTNNSINTSSNRDFLSFKPESKVGNESCTSIESVKGSKSSIITGGQTSHSNVADNFVTENVRSLSINKLGEKDFKNKSNKSISASGSKSKLGNSQTDIKNCSFSSNPIENETIENALVEQQLIEKQFDVIKEKSYSNEEVGANEQKTDVNKHKGDDKEQKGNGDEKKGDVNENKGDVIEQTGDVNEEKEDVNEISGAANEQNSNAAMVNEGENNKNLIEESLQYDIQTMDNRNTETKLIEIPTLSASANRSSDATSNETENNRYLICAEQNAADHCNKRPVVDPITGLWTDPYFERQIFPDSSTTVQPILHTWKRPVVRARKLFSHIFVTISYLSTVCF